MCKLWHKAHLMATCLKKCYRPDHIKPWIRCTVNTWGEVYKVCKKSNGTRMWHHDVVQSSMMVNDLCDDFIRGDIFGLNRLLSVCLCPGVHLETFTASPPVCVTYSFEFTKLHSFCQVHYSWGQLWGEWLLKEQKSNMFVRWSCGTLREEKKVILVQLVHFFSLCKITKKQWWAVWYKIVFSFLFLLVF